MGYTKKTYKFFLKTCSFQLQGFFNIHDLSADNKREGAKDPWKNKCYSIYPDLHENNPSKFCSNCLDQEVNSKQRKANHINKGNITT